MSIVQLADCGLPPGRVASTGANGPGIPFVETKDESETLQITTAARSTPDSPFLSDV